MNVIQIHRTVHFTTLQESFHFTPRN